MEVRYCIVVYLYSNQPFCGWKTYTFHYYIVLCIVEITACNAPHIAGLAANTAATAVERGTTAEQRCVYAPLAQLTAEVARHNLQSPTLVIIGPVVSLSPGWQHAHASGSSLVEGQAFHYDNLDVLATHRQAQPAGVQ